MFIVVTVQKIKSHTDIINDKEGTVYKNQEVRIQPSRIDKYYEGIEGSILDLSDNSRWYVKETPKQLDAMVNAVNPTAAKVLFGK